MKLSVREHGWLLSALLLLASLSVFATPELTPSNSGSEVRCDSSVIINQASAATTQLVALVAGKRIYVCGSLVNQVGATTAPTFKFVAGTGSNCVTGPTDLTGVISGANV